MHLQGTSLDWSELLGHGARLSHRSAVREILKAAVRPDVISFAGGLPAPEFFPRELVAEAAAHLLDADHGARSLQYGESEGLAGLREALAEPCGRPVEQVLITSGAQQGLDLLGRILLNAGDEVMLENPTYLGALGAWRPHGVRFLPIPVDDSGLCVETAAEVLRRHRPKFLYVMPNFHNPCGTVLPLERRQALLTLAEQHGLLIVEDDPYGELRYGGEPLPSLLELALDRGLEDHVVHLRSFSKIVAPGLRIGWLTAAPAIIDALVKAKQAADFHPNVLGQRIILEVIRHSQFRTHLDRLRRAYGQRRDAMAAALRESFPAECEWTVPEGGMFFKVQLQLGHERDGAVDAAALLPRALEGGVAYVTLDHFTLDDSGRDTIRLNFTHAAPEKIHEGIRKLGQLFSSAAATEA